MLEDRFSGAGAVRQIVRTAEFERILRLPRRAAEMPEEWVTKLNELLRDEPRKRWHRLRAEGVADPSLPECVKGGPPDKTLWLTPLQATAIIEAVEYGGLMAPIGAGHGKTPISRLIPELRARRFPNEMQRVLVLVPAALLPQTEHEFRRFARHFDLKVAVKVASYEKLQTVKSKNLIEDYRPTDIICDEAHKLKNPKSARTKRFLRYFKTYPATRCYAMSGTFTKRSLKDYWHLALVCLRERCPIPRRYTEMEAWASCLDDRHFGIRADPGALLEFADPQRISQALGNPSHELQAVREGYQSRLTSVPGVVATSDAAIPASMIVRSRTVKVPESITEALQRLHDLEVTPNGDVIATPLDMARACSELSSGFWHRWDPPAPKDWLHARSAWNSYVRERVSNNRRGWDSPLEIAQAVDSGQLPEGVSLLEAWRAIQDSFEPNPVAQWVSDFLVQDAVEWLREYPNGLVWTCWTAFGHALARAAGVPYFGGGKDASVALADWRSGCVLSIAAHGTGKNLQWASENLIVNPPAGGDIFEQLLARTHRKGQEADEVTFDVYQHTPDIREMFDRARSSAAYISATTGQRQRLEIANYVDFDISRL